MQPKKAKVVFNNGVTGEINLSQADYKVPLEMKLNLKGLKDTVGPWHIHRLPVVSDCSANSTSGHYNPFAVTATYKACEDAAACEAGDLATKFGPLTGGDVQRAIEDPKLTLFGFNRYGKRRSGIVYFVRRTSFMFLARVAFDPSFCVRALLSFCLLILSLLLSHLPRHISSLPSSLTLPPNQSIMGRSVVIHNQDGTRFACGTIKYEDEALTTATANFKTGPYVGKATFSQPSENNQADTEIFMDLKMAEGVAAPTAPVVFAVFDAPCGAAGAKLLNPGDLAACKQFENTSPFKPCALGDLSGRHGLLSLPATGGQALFVTDYLPLSNEGSVVGKSLVIEASGSTPAACADIVAATPATRMLLRVSS